MLRVGVVAVSIVSWCGGLAADEVCVICKEPAKTYRCTVTGEPKALGLEAKDLVESHVCERVLGKTNGHAKCAAVVPDPEDKPCEGAARTVTLRDYVRSLTAEGPSTYDPGAHEVVRKSVHSAWNCMTSMFQDC